MGIVSSLVCARCSSTVSPARLTNLCDCGGPFLVKYDLGSLRSAWRREEIRPLASMWRYAPVLPAEAENAVTLGEGWTPLLAAKGLAKELGLERLWIKDEGQNPTQSFKARGLSCAVTLAQHLGSGDVAIASAGNAGGALAAYAARAGLRAHVLMPRDVPQSNFIECTAHGAQVTLVDGLISDCARRLAERKQREGWFDLSTLKEPYRIEGKKTMGYEIAEQLGWSIPDTIIYPCGGGVGFIGIWKALQEMDELGWIGSRKPKMIAVQAEGCQPIVKAFEQGRDESDAWPDAHTVASGLRVPKAFGDFLVLRIIRESGGTAVAISDQEMLQDGLAMAAQEGIFPAPEGGACISALRKLIATGFIRKNEEVVVLNTGSGVKYLEAYSTRFSRRAASEQDKLGGLITPR